MVVIIIIIFITVRADNARSVAFFLTEHCGDCKKNSLIAIIFWSDLIVHNGPDRGVSMVGPVRMKNFKIERRQETASCQPRLKIISNSLLKNETYYIVKNQFEI